MSSRSDDRRARPDPDRRAPEPAPSDPQSLLDAAVSSIVQAVGGRAGLVRLWDEGPDQEVASSSYGLSDQAVNRLRPIVDDLLPRLDLSTEGSIPTQVDPSALGPVEVGGEPLQAIALPIRAAGRVIGLLCLFQPAGTAPDAAVRDLRLRRMAADQVDVVVQNAHLLERMLEEKRWLEAVVRYSGDGIMILDAEGRIVGLNPAFERLIGRRSDEVRGQFCREVLEPEARSGTRLCPEFCPLLGGRFGPDGTAMIELTYRRRDGSRIDCESTYAVIGTERGRVLGAIVGARDITARRAAEDLQTTFLSVISHELQTPIAIIQGYADLLADPEVSLPEPELRQKLGIIREEGQRLQKMVDNLLTAARVQTGTIELRAEPVDLAWLINRVVQRLGVAHRGRRISVDLPTDLPAVIADAERVEQVLGNLIENAIKYSPPEGRVLVGGRATGTEVVVSVMDEGVGIPPGERERIFERFHRIDSRLVRQLKGAGLGLYVCKAIVEAHQGRIWVEEAPGGGAAFSFSLPRQTTAALPVRFGG